MIRTFENFHTHFENLKSFMPLSLSLKLCECGSEREREIYELRERESDRQVCVCVYACLYIVSTTSPVPGRVPSRPVWPCGAAATWRRHTRNRFPLPHRARLRRLALLTHSLCSCTRISR